MGGPAIVVNELWRDDARYNTVLFNVWKEPLHTIFPPTVREWSGTDMHLWKEGSVRIEDGEPIPQNLKETLPEYGQLDLLKRVGGSVRLPLCAGCFLFSRCVSLVLAT